MKKILFGFTFLIVLIAWTDVHAQYYPNIVSHHFNGTPTSGVKIKTNIPFQSSAGMPLVKIQGYNYGDIAVLDLSVVWYIYDNIFYNYSVSSGGNTTPEVRLSNENGKVTIHLNQNSYYQRFFVSAFAKGMSETAPNYTGWTVVNEAFGGTAGVVVPYKNAFAGDVTFTQGVWNASGNVGIGTNTPTNKLEVNGTIKTKEVNVTTAGWPDYVFASGYDLMSLDSLQSFVNHYNHLPEVPSEKSVLENGVNVGEMNAILLKKIEELTLYLFKLDEELKIVKASNKILMDELMSNQERSNDNE